MGPGRSGSSQLGQDDGYIEDEEMGLSTQQKRNREWRLMKRQQREELDSLIPGPGGGGGDVKVSLAGFAATADRAVVEKLAINTMFILLWYFFAVTLSLYNKWMFSPQHLNFKFPLFTTSLHMAVQCILSSTILYFIPSFRPPATYPQPSGSGPTPRPVITKVFYLTRLVPCGSATSLDIGLGNMSLRFISLTFLTMCKSSALGFVLLFAFLFGLEKPTVKLIAIIGTMTIGVVMMAADEETFNIIGFSLIIASSFFSGFRWGLTQMMLLRHPATANPFSTLFFLTPIMFVTLITIAFLFEGPVEIYRGLTALATTAGMANVLIYLSFPGTLAFCMIASEFALLRRSSVVTLSICGIFKEVITIAAAGIFYNEYLTLVNMLGLIVTLGSIASYNYMKIMKMRQEAQLEVIDIPGSRLGGDSDHEGEYDDPTSTSADNVVDGIRSLFGSKRGAAGGKYSPVTAPGAAELGNASSIHGTDDDDSASTQGSSDRGRGSIRARVNGSFTGFHTSSSPGAPPVLADKGPSSSSSQRSSSKKARSHSREATSSPPDRWNR
ncbi:Triose-phosphate Transporter [Myotisia sp. PD_48]|nr:Triose-phosphate Transporter [Myotisia sp. PD_48]